MSSNVTNDGRRRLGIFGSRGGRHRRDRAPGEPRFVAYLYVLPALAFYLLFTLLPLLHTVWLSFYEWDGITVGKWIGLANYREILADEEIRSAFVHSIKLILYYSVVAVIIALILILVLQRAKVRGLTTFRTLIFLPQTVAVVVVAQAFVWIYAPLGPLNTLLEPFGLNRTWLGEFNTALPALGFVGSWMTFGLAFVLFLAGMQRIPQSLYDAARVDGASVWQEMRVVTLPQLRNELAVVLTLTTITALRSFDLIYNTTSGGPGGETRVPSVLIVLNAFSYGRVGMACAIAVVLTIIIFAVALLITRIGDRGENG
ncbi:MAG: sugar ABC transporter permease [Thermoleophilia bacterium]